MVRRSKHKFNVSSPERRTYRGVVYHSAMECRRARELDRLVAAKAIKSWSRQIRVELVEGVVCVIDFGVVELNNRFYFEEVKGPETPRWRMIKRLWRKHGPCPLKVLKRGKRSKVWQIEWVYGKSRIVETPKRRRGR